MTHLEEMQFSNTFPQNIIWVFFISTLGLPLAFSLSDARISEAGLICGSSKHPESGKFIKKFIALMDIISKKVDDQGWGAEAMLGTPPLMFALGQCHGDLDPKDCSICFTEARTLLPKCLHAASGRIYLDGCFLRYDDHDFFNESLDKKYDTLKCNSPTEDLSDNYLKAEFSNKLDSLIFNLTQKAVSNKFAVAGEKEGVEPVFALAQCWETVDKKGCEKCLAEAGQKVNTCVPGEEGRALNAGCYLRYSTHKFFDDDAGTKLQDHENKSRVGMIVAGALSAIALTLLLILAFLSWKRITERRKSQGGAGSVFKGTLPDGKTVAVKRLFFNSRQWVDEFFNEVNLVSRVQHKNLVKLLGCSIEGPESLLVYEYVPNRSLDQMLFAKNTAHVLSWKQRYNIISGIAEGLAYLHNGCGTKVIHRDIKASNILLDENLSPKIADFGLARCVGPDKSHISTGIAGTLGYMAPEYLIRGQLTEKADVYAFGVLVVEVVCGRKNSVFTGSTSVLHRVWKNYKANNITASIDDSLDGNFPAKEASDVLQIGLLCTQASVALRSSMSEVVQILNDKNCIVPSPKQPPFLNASVLSPDDNTRSSTMNTLSSNKQSTNFTSFHTTRPSGEQAEVTSSHSANSTTMRSCDSSSRTSIVAFEARYN
ncbi:Cysteine-rich receptor-like protein kinase [Quillaja saponaria]|uniref:Cysteine-rich receptor-like protein kinase n=1 Tax=Quillaja saponaria TaxID=32244 RepID=A0AAD7PHW1_QUISA|nr:Cysteine-rich receptor-like protein kinase [Quillaja saponaria]